MPFQRNRILAVKRLSCLKTKKMDEENRFVCRFFGLNEIMAFELSHMIIVF